MCIHRRDAEIAEISAEKAKGKLNGPGSSRTAGRRAESAENLVLS